MNRYLMFMTALTSLLILLAACEGEPTTASDCDPNDTVAECYGESEVADMEADYADHMEPGEFADDTIESVQTWFGDVTLDELRENMDEIIEDFGAMGEEEGFDVEDTVEADQGAEDVDDAAAAEDPGPETGSQGEPVAYHEDADGTESGWEVTVYEVECSTDAIVDHGPESWGEDAEELEPQGQWCVAEMTVTNESNEPRVFPSSSVRLVDSNGAEHGYDMDADGAISQERGEDDHWTFHNMNPGQTFDGAIPYDIPDGVDVESLRIVRAGVASAPVAEISVD